MFFLFVCKRLETAGDRSANHRQAARQPTRHSSATWRVTTQRKAAANVAGDEQFAGHFDSRLLIYVLLNAYLFDSLVVSCRLFADCQIVLCPVCMCIICMNSCLMVLVLARY